MLITRKQLRRLISEAGVIPREVIEHIARNTSEILEQYVDDLEDEIFSFLFQRSTFNWLQKSRVPGQIILDTKLFNEYDNINDVHLEMPVKFFGLSGY